MSGRLFQKDKIPTEPILSQHAVKVQAYIISELLNKYPKLKTICLGSVGKKPYNEYNGDIDIGVKVETLDELNNIITDTFYYLETVENKSLYIISMKYPYEIDNTIFKYVSVDFILIHNIDYAKFRYYCPDYRINESKYKVGTKIMFIGTILNHCLNDDRKKLQTNEHLKYQFLPTGLFVDFYNSKTNNFIQAFCTDNPQIIVNIMFNNCTPDICNTVESIWEALHSDKFKYPDELKNIELAFFINSYRKCWEEFVKPEDFTLQYWTNNEIYNILKQHENLRKINNLFS